MTHSLFLFGNGLGMSIDPEFFTLSRAMKSVWNADILNDDQKEIIQRCLKLDNEGPQSFPNREQQLNTVYNVLFACELLTEIQSLDFDFEDVEQENLQLIYDRTKDFPAALKKYIHAVARQFFYYVDNHNEHQNQFRAFTKQLSDFIIASQGTTTIATLNYDDLLYSQFNEGDVFKEYHLRDGFIRGTFDYPGTLRNIRKYAQKTPSSWYLHLHGSPLFRDEIDGKIKKLERGKLRYDNVISSRHLVLSHHEHKAKIIERSELLKRYFVIFEEKIRESHNIILFGYGGEDTHVNTAIRNLAPTEASIRIVEWSNGTDVNDRLRDWQTKLNRNISEKNLISLDDIKTFNNWALPRD